MTTKKKINIGFDIGITSVGWSLVDEENNIIDRGVRLFEELKTQDKGKLLNQERRDKRTLRRIIRRKQNRKLDFVKLIANKYYDIFQLKSNNVEDRKKEIYSILTNPIFNDVLVLKVKAIKQEIGRDELLKILYNYLSHRGFTYLDHDKYEKRILSIDKISNNNKYKEFANWYLTKNDKTDKKEIEEKAKNESSKSDFSKYTSFLGAIKLYCENKEYIEKLPSILQYEEYLNKKQYRGIGSINDKFFIQDWTKEIEIVLDNQSYINKEFKHDFLFGERSLFSRLRDFSDGPGIGSKYGLYEKDKNGIYKLESSYENLWDKTLGKCSVYPDQFRADKKSVSQEIANILSQLNTLKINNSDRENNFLTVDEKKKIIFDLLKEGRANDLKIISKNTKSLINEIFHYPTDIKKESGNVKSKFDDMKNSRILFNIFNDSKNIKDYDSFINQRDFFNSIINIFSKNPDNTKKQETRLIEELKIDKLTSQEIVISKIDAKQTSSMSLKALNFYIDSEFKDKGLTLNQKFKDNIEKNQEDAFKIDVFKSKYIDENSLDDEIISPTTKCSFRETLKVFNAILKKYIYNGDLIIKNIIFEMPTEWNTFEQEKSINKLQRAQEKKKDKIKEWYKGKNRNIIKKLLLLESQDGRDIYSNEELDREQVISNPSYCDIDHIIPYSISFDNSLNNIVLTLNKYNKEKGQKTPFQYLEKGRYYFLKENLWERLYLNNENKELNNKTKYSYLTLDNLDYKRNIGFIGRNLSDTRYACRAINSYVKTWVNKMAASENQKEIWKDNEVNIINVNGRFTQRYRWEKFLNIPKVRDDYSHHAIDATICALLGNTNYTMGKLVWYKNVDHSTGEVLSSSKSDFKNIQDIEKLESMFDSEIKWHDIKDEVNNKHVKFSYKLNKKDSFKLWGDSTISVLKKEEDKYWQFNKTNLLDINDLEATAKFIDHLKKDYIVDGKIKYPDPKLFEDVLKCYEEGVKLCMQTQELNKKNPFLIYMYEFNKVNNIKDSPTKLALNRDGHIYYVKSLKTHKNIESFEPVKKNLQNIQNKFGVHEKLGWKEIRLYKDSKGYRIVPIQASFSIDKLGKFNIEKNSKYYSIHKGQTLINKSNNKDICKIVGGKFGRNQLEIKPIYKSLKKEDPRIILSIDGLLEKYDFCDIDMLGNYWIKKLDL